ncbi:kelch repeat-containing protein, partial [Archangium violaceum]|uniref:kelch repeat-containing protein n=1 Tax=Archangium violaceum TaxID=83451 RepID=UPI0005B7702F
MALGCSPNAGQESRDPESERAPGISSARNTLTAATPGWRTTGSLRRTRERHTATLLPTGQVLVSGGYGEGEALTSVDVYEPATGAWSATDSLASARYGHTATLLPTGQVLVSGGYWASG